MRVLIIGGVAGGMSAATRLRRLDETAEIVVFERGPYVSFANCGLPYHVGGVIAERDALLLQTPESLRSRFALDVRIGTEVTAIDRAAQTVTVREAATGATTIENYDRLILAMGADDRSRLSPAPDGPVVSTLRTVDDVDRIVAALPAGTTDARAVVAGGGFIGLEAVENLVHRGLQVTLVQHGAHPLSGLDAEMAAPLLDTLRAHGVQVRTGATVAEVDATGVTLADGTRIACDLVIDARGVTPATGLARDAGLQIGPAGGIRVDGHQRTSDPRIFAVGDGVEKTDAVTGEPVLVTMAGLANRHGRHIADVIASERTGVDLEAMPSALGTGIIQVFETTAAMTGWSEQRLRAAGLPHRVIHTHPSHHATYYPGAERMSMKLMVAPESDRILGAQIVGGRGVDKRIDVIATAMHAGITASGLSRLELAYAPQFASAKDPVNLIGYAADNLATGLTGGIQWHELDAALSDGATLIDVRSADEYAAGAIPGSVNVPLDELRDRLGELPAGELIVHCQVGQRGHTAARLLAQTGRAVRNLDGGYLTWRDGARMSGQEQR